MSIADRKTIFDLDSIIKRCLEECKKMGYIQTLDNSDISDLPKEKMDAIANQDELVHHISLTVIGELYEFEIIRRIAPLFRENRALTTDFQAFGEAFQQFYDKTVADAALKGIRIHPEGQ